jgi:hypothetical protein
LAQQSQLKDEKILYYIDITGGISVADIRSHLRPASREDMVFH